MPTNSLVLGGSFAILPVLAWPRPRRKSNHATISRSEIERAKIFEAVNQTALPIANQVSERVLIDRRPAP
jgi:hypothetical protein